MKATSRTSILQTEWARNPAIAGAMAAALLFSTSLVAATVDSVPSGTEISDSASDTASAISAEELVEETTGEPPVATNTENTANSAIEALVSVAATAEAPEAAPVPTTEPAETAVAPGEATDPGTPSDTSSSEARSADEQFVVEQESSGPGTDSEIPGYSTPESSTSKALQPDQAADAGLSAAESKPESEPAPDVNLAPEIAAGDPPEPASSLPSATQAGQEAVESADAATDGAASVAIDTLRNEQPANPSVTTDEPNSDPLGVGTDNTPEPPPMPVAEDVDLSEPVIPSSETSSAADLKAPEPASTPDPVAAKESETKPPLVLLGEEVAPGTSARLSWSPDQHFDGISVPTPVLVVNGVNPGKTLCLTAAIHGDELNGIEIVRRVMYDLDAEDLNGTVIGVPIVNLQGFRRNSRYLPDRRDLNRFFPGRAGGSSASRMAHSFFSQVIIHCDALVDIHTGSFLRTNLPQLRADMSVPEVAELTEGFGATAVLHSSSTDGTLRRAAVLAGIPSVTLETGEPSRLQEKEIEHGTKGIQTLLTKLKMTRRVRVWGDPEPVYYKSTWVRADDGGLLFSSVKLGQRVRKNQVLGTITDPITNVRSELVSPSKGRVLGMALNQVVLPGFATFRIGIPSNEKEVVVPPDVPGEELPDQPASDQILPNQDLLDIPDTVPTDVDIEDENS